MAEAANFEAEVASYRPDDQAVLAALTPFVCEHQQPVWAVDLTNHPLVRRSGSHFDRCSVAGVVTRSAVDGTVEQIRRRRTGGARRTPPNESGDDTAATPMQASTNAGSRRKG